MDLNSRHLKSKIETTPSAFDRYCTFRSKFWPQIAPTIQPHSLRDPLLHKTSTKLNYASVTTLAVYMEGASHTVTRRDAFFVVVVAKGTRHVKGEGALTPMYTVCKYKHIKHIGVEDIHQGRFSAVETPELVVLRPSCRWQHYT